MRGTARLYAVVSQSAPRTLKPGAPTGLTGLLTHPAPRSTLIYLYSSTLSKLQQIPESSVYRQATEALTRKRLDIIKAVKPPGFDIWNEEVQHHLNEIENEYGEGKLTFEGQRFVLGQMYTEHKDSRETEYGGNTPFQILEGPVSQEMRDAEKIRFENWLKQSESERPSIKPEPLLTVDQVKQLEEQFDSGLLEEVIEVAKGEDALVDVMVKNKVWEDLVEKSPEGQWSYFER